jgi:hypothetical protein
VSSEDLATVEARFKRINDKLNSAHRWWWDRSGNHDIHCRVQLLDAINEIQALLPLIKKDTWG